MPSKHFLRDTVKHALSEYLVATQHAPVSKIYDLVLAEVEWAVIDTVIRHTAGNQSQAAKLLGLSRGTLLKLLKKYQLLNRMKTGSPPEPALDSDRGRG